jgi:CubicO group peptidase (beta-lactamase class C family)
MPCLEVSRLKRIPIVILLFVCSTASAQNSLEPAWKRVDEFVARSMQERGTPGVALAVTDRNGVLHVATYGFADLKAKKPVTPQTRFEIGSLSKSFTAIALLQLREQGKLDLNAPITKYIPWFRVQSGFAPITTHHVLSHTAGLPRDRDDVPSSLYQAIALSERKTFYEPGKYFAYSNIGYQTLGYMLEELTGRGYHEVVAERILAPLGMSASQARFTHADRDRLAVGYVGRYDDRPYLPAHGVVEATWIEYAAGDGSIIATAADLAAYARMLLNRGAAANGRVLSPESFELLIQRAVQTPGDPKDPSWYGYGLGTSKSKQGHLIVSHSGGMVGYSSMLTADMDDGLAVVVFVNGPGAAGAIADFALAAVRAARTGKDMPALPSPAPLKTEDYVGEFTGEGGRKLVFRAAGDGLALTYQGRDVPLIRRGRDVFMADHPDFALFPLRFRRDKDAVVGVTHGGDWFAGSRYSGARPAAAPKEWEAYAGHYRTQHPWFNNFRVVVREGKLWMVTPGGEEVELLPAKEAGLFEGRDEDVPTREQFRFSHVVRGQAQRVNFSGVDYYRTFTP